MPRYRIERATVTEYRTYLIEAHRPPSRGGNTAALHRHYLTVDGLVYNFRALGTRRWVFKRDKVTFEFERNGSHLNIKPETLRAIDSAGKEVVRGNRGTKRVLRTAETRLPVSRREARD